MSQSSVSASHPVNPSAIDSALHVAPAQTAGVTLRSVTKKYGSFTAVENVNLEIPAGSYCCLLGPSGCGKTSTLRMIAGHEEVTSGEVWIGDQRVDQLPPARRNTAMVFQNYALFPHKTVWQNIEFGLKMAGVTPAERKSRVEEMLAIVGLEKFAQRKPAMLSGGQQQRVALARALVTRPQVLLLDEPLSALDENLRVKTRGELRKLQKQFGMTFIQVTHGQDEAFALSDQIVVMDHGHIDQIGTPEQIFATPASRFVARFVGDNNLFVGQVTGVSPNTIAGSGCVVQLEVDRIGTFLCRGQAADVGMTAACCVRSDRMIIAPYPALDPDAPNQLAARVTAIEFTGYITRVSLMLEATGEEITYKVRTHDWIAQEATEGQLVTLQWATNDCVFLSH
ncbi:ABC transporter ATP-binding protein [Leptolyngbya sp. FACHB-711]|uniref:ABC transporter ATP-binding protein n=1 Tax=unclassified Leptolyngbya TaxID=2650499 RepID=UPI001682776A|nr:ABC transporter ATP-binding protein [Leptolyngbya sp. FACHB-711]MBD1849484.1 ABC transporter ATP-binding protein [Cyanobacteria bacterium FACHB-502]MBD2023217.1 ABC transporter ATP-binding protein [Leptolyngbya sp. FACHB-711]